jgi:hypothetical protein
MDDLIERSKINQFGSKLIEIDYSSIRCGYIAAKIGHDIIQSVQFGLLHDLKELEHA